MRSILWGLTGALVLSGLGCAGSPTPLAPSSTPSSPTSQLGAAILQQDLAQSALGIYTLDIDPVSLEATATLKATRGGAANDDLYLLPIDNFLRPDSLRVTAVSSTATTLELSYTFSHPFPAPENPAGAPNGFSNRADLSIAGKLLFLTDVADATGNTYFTDRVANTELVLNPDAYWDPAGLITPGTLANVFPYHSLVDESGPDGSRVGISNGGDPTGNFGNDGWTRGELGFDQNGWTGFEILHGGQTSAGTLSLSRAALAAAGSFSLDVAVIARYNDPRGGTTGVEKRANRLPPEFPDTSLFAYRMPHGALDVSRIVFLDSSDPYITGSLSASTLSFHVQDWDARAIETTVGDLSGDFDVTTVAVGEAGVPTLAVSIPGVIGDATQATELLSGVIDDDSAFGGDPAQDSGRPGDLLFYSDAVNSVPSGPASSGEYTGLVRATDVEIANISDPNFIIELDGSLTPLASNIPVPETYQVFTVSAQTPVSNNGFAVRYGGTGSEEPRATAVDSQGNIYVGGRFTQSVDFGGGLRSTTGSSDYDCFLLKLDPNGAYLWDRVWGSPNFGIVERIDGLAIDANDNVLAIGWTRGPVDFGGGPVATTGFSDVFMVKYAPDSTLQWVKVFGPPTTGNSAEGYGITADNAGNVYGTGYFTTTVTPPGGSPMTSLGSFDGFLVKYSPTGTFTWAKSFGGTAAEWGEGLTTDPAGNVYLAGAFNGSMDLGGGLIVPSSASSNGFMVKYNPAGVYQFDKKFGATGAGWSYEIEANATTFSVSGFFNGTIDFGGGNRASVGAADPYVVQYNSGGLWQWDYTAGSSAGDWGRGHAIDPIDGSIYLVGDYSTGANFGGGPRTTVSSRDMFVVKLNSAGVYQWDSVWGGSTDFCWEMDVDPNGNPVIGGYFSGTCDFDPSPAVFNLTSAGSTDGFVNKLQRATGLW